MRCGSSGRCGRLGNDDDRGITTGTALLAAEALDHQAGGDDYHDGD
jgi:hypothetical protein